MPAATQSISTADAADVAPTAERLSTPRGFRDYRGSTERFIRKRSRYLGGCRIFGTVSDEPLWG